MMWSLANVYYCYLFRLWTYTSVSQNPYISSSSDVLDQGETQSALISGHDMAVSGLSSLLDPRGVSVTSRSFSWSPSIPTLGSWIWLSDSALPLFSGVWVAGISGDGEEKVWSVITGISCPTPGQAPLLDFRSLDADLVLIVILSVGWWMWIDLIIARLVCCWDWNRVNQLVDSLFFSRISQDGPQDAMHGFSFSLNVSL